MPEMLSGNFENKGKVQAGVDSSESIPFIQIRTSPFYDTKALKKSSEQWHVGSFIKPGLGAGIERGPPK